MNSLVRVFSNFREFYSEINGATLTGAIDVIVVEQPNGEFQCSPFHVRFGKLGVLRSREKIVDIEINGEPVDIHMKLGESGEAFFVEECPEEDIEELPANLATSPIPTSDFQKYDEVKNFTTASGDTLLPLPIPRRNSIDFSKECNDEKDDKNFENQVSDFKCRRHTDNTMERRDLSIKKKEFTTLKIRQEWAELAEHKEHRIQLESSEDCSNNTLNTTIQNDEQQKSTNIKSINESIIDINLANKIEINDTKDETITITVTNNNNTNINNNTNTNNNNNNGQKDESKMKKKRRKKSQMKKKNIPRKSSSSSSVGSNIQMESNEADPDTVSLSNNTGGSSNDESSSKNEDVSTKSGELKTAEDQTIIDSFASSKSTLSGSMPTTEKISNTPNRIRDLDIHFFSDTEVTSTGFNTRDSRPSTPIQSDSELEISQREKNNDANIMTNSASWKWGELPTQNEEEKHEPQAQRNSMLSGMFSFMKKTNKMRKNADGGVYLSELDADGMDPEMAALYFPPINKDHRLTTTDDDGESGNGTSLPHSPSSMDCPKSLDSDYEEGKTSDNKYLDFVAMSMCGGIEKGGPTDEEFDQHLIKYSDVCQNPSLFSAPNLVVRLNGKYYSWIAACPIIMTIITFKKPLSNDAIEQLMNGSKINTDNVNKSDSSINSPSSQETKRAGYSSWWYWRRSGGEKPNIKDNQDKNDNTVSIQSTASNTPDGEQEDLSILNSDITTENNADISQPQNISIASSKGEKYRKTLRLSSDAIKRLNLKSGMNEIEFSVTTAYQGTSRCKCYLFRWKHNDKVVISDIDGTITKSDVLGHILPMVGKDWAQIGVAQLFSKIEENGYKLLYLSARAIGQSRVTREYLRSIRQGDVKLPDGPLLLNPTSLISAFHREVIERKPEQFKIACLSDIQALFPEKNPFYAGYGNRINDVWAYRAVGIPIMRIFTINTKGELKHELTQTFQSSYCSMTYIVDQLFPPLKDDEGAIEFSNFNYWREPIVDLDLDLINISNLSSLAINGAANINNNTILTNTTIVPSTKPLATIPEN